MKQIPGKIVWKDHEAMSLAAAHFFAASCQQAISRLGRFVVALSGGNTPKRFYELLATADFSKNIPWKKIFLFWSDERFVTHGSPESNYNMVRKSLLEHIDIPAKNIFPVPVSGDPEQCAQQYAMSIRKFFNNKPIVFDWVLLGTGDDGHTASLFPNTPALIENRRLIRQVWLEEKQAWRITFTYPLINRAKQIIVLVSGKQKRHVVNAVFSGSSRKLYPVQYVNAEKSIWFMDKMAAG